MYVLSLMSQCTKTELYICCRGHDLWSLIYDNGKGNKDECTANICVRLLIHGREPPVILGAVGDSRQHEVSTTGTHSSSRFSTSTGPPLGSQGLLGLGYTCTWYL